MLSQNYSKRYEGIIDDPDMNLWPAPLKIADQTINSMTEFRVRIQCVHYNLEYYGFDMYLGIMNNVSMSTGQNKNIIFLSVILPVAQIGGGGLG